MLDDGVDQQRAASDEAEVVCGRFGKAFVDDLRDPSWSDLREMLERHAAVVGVERGSNSEIAEIIGLHEQMRELFEARDRLPYYKLNQAIHTKIVALAHNETLNTMHESLQMRLRRIRYVGNEKPTSWSGAMREHEMMMTALKARDGEGLAQAISEHFDETNERIVAYLQTTEATIK